MSTRKFQEPFTMPKHGALLQEINETIIGAKLHHCHPPERTEKPEEWAKAQSHSVCPTWEGIVDLLDRAYKAINEQRFNPVKY